MAFRWLLAGSVSLLSVASMLGCSGEAGGNNNNGPLVCPGEDAPLPLAGDKGPLVTAGTEVVLAGSGDKLPATPLPPLTAAAPSEPELAAPLVVNLPDARCPRLLHFVSPQVAIPMDSTVRVVEARWNGAPLAVIDAQDTDITETPHSYGEQLPFFHPVFSLEGVEPGGGKLEVVGLDGKRQPLLTRTLENLEIVAPPKLITACAIKDRPHPRLFLSGDRLDRMRARPDDDPARTRYFSPKDGVDFFIAALQRNSDPTSQEFGRIVYDPESYIPALALCYQLAKTSDPARATICAKAARTLAVDIAHDYDSGARSFSRDSGYDIRFALEYLMLALDWLYDELSGDERSLFVSVANRWLDWYEKEGYARTHPFENYYAGYLAALTMTVIATSGDNSQAQRLIELLHQKLYWEMPVMNQRLCGGDWPEGWNYGPYSILQLALVDQALRDLGEDWKADFDFLDGTARSLTHQMAPDLSELRSFGGYSGTLPHKTSPSMLAVLSGVAPSGGLAARLYRDTLAAPENDLADTSRGFTAQELIFFDPSRISDATPPLSYYTPGTGRFFSRSSWSADAYQVTAENIGYYYDHFGYANGDVRLYKGGACLLCPSAYRGPSFRGEDYSSAFSTFLVDGKEQGTGARDAHTLFVIEDAAFSAIAMRFDSSYGKGGYDEDVLADSSPLDYLIREVVHLRPGVLVVRDLVRRRKAGVPVRALWHLPSQSSPQMLGANAWKIGDTVISALGPRTTKFVVEDDRMDNPIGTRVEDELGAGGGELELITLISDGPTLQSYVGGVVTVSNGQCVRFGGGTVKLGCP